MEIKIGKRDVLWSYFSQFFNIASGFITLPLVLRMLTTEEIALNYLMMTVSSLVALMDFGFTPQIGRLVSYIFSGAQSLKREGINECANGPINYSLLGSLINITKKIFWKLSIAVLLFMLTFGTIYIYNVTNGFSTVDNSLIIWGIFSVSQAFNIYYKYYDTLLTGRGLIEESRKTMLASRISYIVLAYLLLFCNFGLLGLCIANFISPFIQRYLSYRYFYDKDLLSKIKDTHSTGEEQSHLFDVIWYNAKKLGINFIGGYCITKFGLFISGIYLSSTDIASYGLLTQLVTIIVGISTTLYNTMQPQIISYRINGNKEKTMGLFSFTMLCFYSIFIILGLMLLSCGPVVLSLIRSNAVLPSSITIIVYLIIILLENNHSLFATFITTGNKIPFVKAGLISGFFIWLGDCLILNFTGAGVIGLILVQGFVQLCYSNWRWPKWVLNEYNISYLKFLTLGVIQVKEESKVLVNKFRM